MNEFQQYIAKSHYCRWNEKEGRRETWEEAVSRYSDWVENYIYNKTGYENLALFSTLKGMIRDHEIMPSMRALYSAGKALDSNNCAAYNCAYLPISSPIDIAELLFLCMSTVGVGFSVEKKYVEQWPSIPEGLNLGHVIKVGDTREDWANAVKYLIQYRLNGYICHWDLSNIRPAGSKLHTFGGYASGPEPLDELLHGIVRIIGNRAGKKLRSIDLFDICCMAGDAAVAGGVRRSALLALTDFDDEGMRNAKSGDWHSNYSYRSMANISTVYATHKVTPESFMQEWLALYSSKSGERGIFNRAYAYTKTGIEDIGTNPCGEILLRPYQFCNLTSVIVRPDDTKSDLVEKVQYATILGTFQACIDDFHYLRPIWKYNAERDRLLGVSLTGVMDNQDLLKFNGHILQFLHNKAREVNKDFSKKLGIEPARSITCIKPEGTVSQLTNTSSGIHPRYSKYYVRRVQRNRYDPINQVLRDSGIYFQPSRTRSTDDVFEFYLESPDGAKYVYNTTAIEQLELIQHYQTYWADHNISATVYVREHEWLEVAAWVFKHIGTMCGITFFPLNDHNYEQAPYERLTEVEYDLMPKPKIKWELLPVYEFEDMTTGSREYACVGGACEIG